MKKENKFTKVIAIVLSLVIILGMGSVTFASTANTMPSVTPSVTPSITPSVTHEATPQTYKVVSSKSEYGALKLEKEDYQVGEAVVLNIKANDGFEVASVSAYTTKDIANETIDIFNDKSVKIKDNTFVMPASDVRVLVDFVEKEIELTETPTATPPATQIVEPKGPTPTPKADVEEKSNEPNKDVPTTKPEPTEKPVSVAPTEAPSKVEETQGGVKSNTIKFVNKGDAYTLINYGGATIDSSLEALDFNDSATLDLSKLVDGKAWLRTSAGGEGVLKKITYPDGIKETIIVEEPGLGGFKSVELDFSGIKNTSDIVIDFTGVQMSTYVTGFVVNKKATFTVNQGSIIGTYVSGAVTEMTYAKYGDTKTWGNGFWKIARPSLNSTTGGELFSKFGMTMQATDKSVAYTDYGCDGNYIWMRCTGTTHPGTDFDGLTNTTAYVECMSSTTGDNSSTYRFRMWVNDFGGQTKEGYFEIKVIHQDIDPVDIRLKKTIVEKTLYGATTDMLGNKNTSVKPQGTAFTVYKLKSDGLKAIYEIAEDAEWDGKGDFGTGVDLSTLDKFYASINTNAEFERVLGEIEILISDRTDSKKATYPSGGNPESDYFKSVASIVTAGNGYTPKLEIEVGSKDWYVAFETRVPAGATTGWSDIEVYTSEHKDEQLYFFKPFGIQKNGDEYRVFSLNPNTSTKTETKGELNFNDAPILTGVLMKKVFEGIDLVDMGFEPGDVKFLLSSKANFSDAISIPLELRQDYKDQLVLTEEEHNLIFEEIGELKKTLPMPHSAPDWQEEIDRIMATIRELEMKMNETEKVPDGDPYYGIEFGTTRIKYGEVQYTDGLWSEQVYYLKEDPNCKAVTSTPGYKLNEQVYSFMPKNDGRAYYSNTVKHDLFDAKAIDASMHPYIGSETGGIVNEAPPSELQLKKVSSNPAITDGNDCYSRAGAVFTVYDANGDVAKDTSGKDVILITDGNGESQTVTIKAGTYTVRETTAPKGYKLSTEVKMVTLEAGETREVEFADEPLNDPVQLALKKVDADTGEVKAQGEGTFAGAEYTFKFYNGQYTKEQLAGKTPTRTWVLATNALGEIDFRIASKVSGDEFFIDDSGYRTFPLGTVTIQESKEPKGYLINNEVYLININENPQKKEIEVYEIPVADEPVIRGGVKFYKSDAETRKHETQGDGDFATTIEIINDSAKPVEVEELDINGQPTGAGVKSYAKGDIVATIKLSDEGEWTSANNWLSYGKYIANETVEAVGYLWKSQDAVTTVKFAIKVDGRIVGLTEGEKHTDDEYTTFYNDPIRLDVRGIKIKDGQADGSLNRLANIPFRLTHIKSGESHILSTDPNGELSTVSGWKALAEGSTSGDGVKWTKHDYNTNANDRDDSHENGYNYDDDAWKNGIWFGDPALIDNSKGALLYGKYRVEELPCEANKGLVLLDFTFDAHLPGGVINLGTLTDDVTPPPAIGTIALSVEGTKILELGDEITVTDEIRYSNFKTNTKYKAKGHFVDYQSGEIITGVSELEFATDDKTSGVIKVPFKLNTNDIAGKAIVAMEEVYEIKDDGDEVLIAEHKDKEDKGQTLTVVEPEPTPEPSISTVALSVDGTKILELGDEVVANDEIRYSNFKTNTRYKAKGHFVDYQSTNAVTEVSELEFTTGDETSGVVKVPFKLNTNDIAGKAIVAMEEVYEIKDDGDEVLIAEHKDLEDKGQTLTVVEREPEPTPEPTVTPKPTATPKLTATPKPTPTKTPTPTPTKDEPTTTTTSSNTPKTGDNAQMVLWLGLGGIALIGAVGAVIYKKKRRTTVTK